MNLEDLYRLLRSSHVQAQGIVDTIDEPLVVLDERTVVLEANRAFFATFLVERDDTIGASLYNLGNGQWNMPALRRLSQEAGTVEVSWQVTPRTLTHRRFISSGGKHAARRSPRPNEQERGPISSRRSRGSVYTERWKPNSTIAVYEQTSFSR